VARRRTKLNAAARDKLPAQKLFMKISVLRLIGHESLALALYYEQEAIRSKRDILASVFSNNGTNKWDDFPNNLYS
jgi:hypothetical protein